MAVRALFKFQRVLQSSAVFSSISPITVLSTHLTLTITITITPINFLPKKPTPKIPH